MNEQQMVTLDYFTGRVERVRSAVEKAVEGAGAYGSDQLVTDLEWTQYVHDHVHTARRDETEYIDDPKTLSHLDELWVRYRLG